MMSDDAADTLSGIFAILTVSFFVWDSVYYLRLEIWEPLKFIDFITADQIAIESPWSELNNALNWLGNDAALFAVFGACWFVVCPKLE